MAEYIIQEETLKSIANAVRTKTGKTNNLSPSTMASDLNAIAERTSSNLTASGATVTVPAGNYKTQASKSVATATRAKTTISVSADDTNDTLTITASNNQSTGYVTGANKTASKTISLTASGAIVTASDGTNKVSKSVATATQATPSISVDSAGKITASATQTAGYVAAGTKSATKQLTTKAAATITPGTSNQTIAAGTYLTGAQTIAGDADLKAANIKKGVNIFNVAGSFDGVELNFKIVGGTSTPSNPTNNTIWINTDVPIPGWDFASSNLTESEKTNGFVIINYDAHFQNENGGLKGLIRNSNNIYIKPKSAIQLVEGRWVEKTLRIYQNGWITITKLPEFTYNGNYESIMEDDENWKIKFLTSGNLQFTSLNGAIDGIDVFLVGGGGQGGTRAWWDEGTAAGGGGGGGGYITINSLTPNTTTIYPITIGGSGGQTSAFSFAAAAGGAGGASSAAIYSGPGGAGTGNGGNGGNRNSWGGSGGGAGKYEFNNSSYSTNRYGGGGGGGGAEGWGGNGSGGKGGAGGGGAGGNGATNYTPTPGTTNTGGGGGGAGGSHTYVPGGLGGSGIVIIRNKRGNH